MAGAFERLAQSVLRHLGQDAFLLSGADTTTTRVNVEYAVAMAGPYDDGAFQRDGATYILDGVVSANGHLHRFTIIKAP
jgi:hypothetical protein